MKFKLSNEQLGLLVPVLHGFIIYAAMQLIFIVAVALRVEQMAAFFTLGWFSAMLMLGVLDARRYLRHYKETKTKNDALAAKMNAVCAQAQAIIANNANNATKRVEGDEWKDN